jgi:3-hydroxyisobutyrate dehydrogenase
MKIGLLGTGKMGSAMVERLINCGHELVIWNRSIEKTAPLVTKGATVAASPAQLVDQVEIIISILTDAQAIDACYRAPGGVLSTSVAGKLFIEMSTVRPVTAIAIASDVNAKGGAMVDCPVGGTVGPAREGKL